MSDLDQLIPPETINDEFYALIKKLAREEPINNVLEIGSSAGGGSTQALVEGLTENPKKPELLCIELSKPRFQALKQRYQSQPFVKCYNASSVSAASLLTPSEVTQFYNAEKTELNQYLLEQVLDRLSQEKTYIVNSGVAQNGIEIAKQEQHIDFFDLVLIDGSAFSGNAELSEIYGANLILLNGINDIRCLGCYRRLRGDRSYKLEYENWNCKKGFAVFKKIVATKSSQKLEGVSIAASPNQVQIDGSSKVLESITRNPNVAGPEKLPIHFFTIVLNGEPFIRHHIEVLKQLPFKWHWHIVEGVAKLEKCTAWSLKNGGRVSNALHLNGLSNDGTTEYLDQVKKEFPSQVTVYRKLKGEFWAGKLEMVEAPLSNIHEECLLWEIDADELWLPSQIATTRQMFMAQPEKTAARYRAHFFVGPDLVISSREGYGNNPGEWLRTWRYRPGDFWKSHEPPCLCRRGATGEEIDLSLINAFTNAETESAGLVFQHYAYVVESQIRFKQIYYGYKTAANDWRDLQRARSFPILLGAYFSWIKDEEVVASSVPLLKLHPIAQRNILGEWRFRASDLPADEPREIVYVRTDAIGDAVLSSPILVGLRKKYRHASITVVCQEPVAEYYEACPYVDRIIKFSDLLARNDEAHRMDVMKQIKERCPDLVLNPVYSPRLSTHVFSLCQANAKTYGMHGDLANIEPDEQSYFEAMYTKVINTDPDDIELTHNQDFMRGAGLDPIGCDPQFWLKPEDEAVIEARIGPTGINKNNTVAIFAGALLPVKSSLEIGMGLRKVCGENKFTVVALGAEKDREVNQGNCEESAAPYLNLSGALTLRQSAAMLKRCRLAVGVDTSLAHIAAALGVPHVIVYGGGQFGRFLPYSPLTSLVILPLSCYKCNWSCRYSLSICIMDIFPASIELAARKSLTEVPGAKPRLFVQQNVPPRKRSVYPRILEPSEVCMKVDCDVYRC